MLYCLFRYFFFFKQKTAYEMRISDWSSDVCSSDLIEARLLDRDALRQRVALARHVDAVEFGVHRRVELCLHADEAHVVLDPPRRGAHAEIGRASGRERMGQYV